MEPCAKPVSEQTAGEIASCAGDAIKDAAMAVVSHPGSANITQWTLAILLLLVVVLVLGSLVRR
jgi:hypothetical protein